MAYRKKYILDGEASRMRQILYSLKILLFFAVYAVFTGAVAYADWQMGMQEPASEISQVQQDLNIFMMWIITIIGVIVFGAMFYSIIYHRKSRGHKSANFHENTVVEILWTAVPMLIIVVMAWPATTAILKLKDTSSPDITVKVTGHQWKWSYDYLDEEVSFYSQLSTPPEEIGGKYYSSDEVANPQSNNYLLEVNNEFVVPVGKKIRLLITAADVIHSWWVPQLGVKQDAIPGLVRDAWFKADREGLYRGQCAELCGKNHGFMPIVVRAVSEEDYATWLTSQQEEGVAASDDSAPTFVSEVQADAMGDTAQASDAGQSSSSVTEWTMEYAMKAGETGYKTYCSACHQPNGEGLLPAFPALKNSPIATGDVASHIDIVVNGKSGTTMAAFNYLSDEELAAIITYERNAWGNDTGSVVTPDDIKLAR